MPTVLRIVIDTVTNGSAPKGKIIIRSIGAMLRTAVVDLGRMPDPHVLDSKTGDEKVAAPEADERAGEGRDVALGAPCLHEQVPIRNQREVEIEEQAQDRNADRPPCQWRRQVGPPDPEGAPENQRQEQEEQQRPGNVPGRGAELRVNRVDGEGQPEREGDDGRDGQDHQQRGGDADIRLGHPGEDGSERHPRTQGCDTEPDLDLVREWTRRSSADSR